MTSFKEAQAKGLKWPMGPDDLAPSKQQNTYLYGGGRTRKLKNLLAAITLGWGLTNYGLDRYLTKNRKNVKNNYRLERALINSSRYFLPVCFVLWFGLPVSQAVYWWVLKVTVGAKPTNSRNPIPNWKVGENPFSTTSKNNIKLNRKLKLSNYVE